MVLLQSALVWTKSGNWVIYKLYCKWACSFLEGKWWLKGFNFLCLKQLRLWQPSLWWEAALSGVVRRVTYSYGLDDRAWLVAQRHGCYLTTMQCSCGACGVMWGWMFDVISSFISSMWGGLQQVSKSVECYRVPGHLSMPPTSDLWRPIVVGSTMFFMDMDEPWLHFSKFSPPTWAQKVA